MAVDASSINQQIASIDDQIRSINNGLKITTNEQSRQILYQQRNVLVQQKAALQRQLSSLASSAPAGPGSYTLGGPAARYTYVPRGVAAPVAEFNFTPGQGVAVPGVQAPVDQDQFTSPVAGPPPTPDEQMKAINDWLNGQVARSPHVTYRFASPV